MCIAIASRIGQNIPDEETLRACWDNNPDGAGFAFARDGVVYIKKGFMTFDAFINAFRNANSQYNFKDCGVLIHFRIATHGGVNPEMTHPFPIVEDTGALSKLEYVSDYAVIHNGTISLTGYKAQREHKVSDTAVFVRDYLSKIAQNKQWFKRRANMELIELLIESKMAILNGRGEIINTSGFTDDNGILYSNTTYKVARVKKSSNYNYSNYSRCCYDYEYDDYNYEGYSSYSGYPSYHSGKTSAKTTIPMMRCFVGDSIECDSFSDVCSCESDRIFVVSKEGYMYCLIAPDGVTSPSAASYSLEFIGYGKFYDRMAKEREFHANFYAYKHQFLGECDPDTLTSGE